VEISCGDSHTIAREANGQVWAWGLGNEGQLGYGGTSTQSSPVAVAGGFSFVTISAGGDHNLALTELGEAWGWGKNDDGRLGDNSTTRRPSPVSVVGDHSFQQVSAGSRATILSYGHSAALKEDGTAWCWGKNSSGQCGDNTNTDRSSPVSVVGDHIFKEIAAGNGFTFGIKDDCGIWSWGWNDSGRLGDNTTTNRSSPVFVVGGYNWCWPAVGKIMKVQYSGR
jgi:alpha-tubulin suppressor-like RCC1 family protein